MKCPQCGIEGDGKFCQECGTKLAVKAKVILCPVKDDEGNPCNAEISSDQKFCKNCGHPVDQVWFWSGKCEKCGATCPERQNLCATCVMAQTSVEAAPCPEGKDTYKQQRSPVPDSANDRPQNETSKTGDEMEETSSQKLSPEETAYQTTNEPIQKLQNSEAINPQDPNQEQLMEVGSSTDTTKDNPLVKSIQHFDLSHMNQNDSTDRDAGDIPTPAGFADTVTGNEDTYASKQVSDMEVDLQPQGEISERNETNKNLSFKDEIGENISETQDPGKTLERTIDIHEPHPDETEDSLAHDLTHDTEDDSSDSDESTNGPDSFGCDESSNPSLGDKESENRMKQGKKRRGPSSLKAKNKLKRAKKAAKLRKDHPPNERMPREEHAYQEEPGSKPENIEDHKAETPVFGMTTRSKSKAIETDTPLIKSDLIEASESVIPSFFKLDITTKSSVNSSVSSTSKTATNNANGDEKKDTKGKKNEQNVKNQNAAQKDKQTAEPRPIHDKDFIRVVFHVLVSKKLLEHESNRVLLKFESQDLGGWGCIDHVATPKRQFAKHIEYCYERYMPRNLLTTTVWYKYCIFKGTSYVFENYYDSTSFADIHNRKLLVYQDRIAKKDSWHQYDGVAVSNPSTNVFTDMLNYFRGRFRKKSIKRMDLFVSLFCPEWFCCGIDVMTESFQESLDKLDSLLFCMRRMYFTHAKCFDNESEFKQQIVLNMLSPGIEELHKRIDANKMMEDTVMRAMAFVIACNRLQLDIPKKDWQYLCRCLVVSADCVDKKCFEYEDVKTLSSTNALKRALLNMVKCQPKTEKNPSWMLCLPLLHFVSGVCQPYDVLGEDMSHNVHTLSWWGIVDIQTEIDQFKGNKNKWTIPLENVMTCLQPLFRMDPYLSRSIVAALTPPELTILFRDYAISIEICLASLLFWSLHTTPNYRVFRPVFEAKDTEEKAVYDCLKLLLNRLQNIVVENDESLNNWTLAYKIGADGVEKMDKTDTILKLAYWGHIFLHSITIHRLLFDKMNTNQTTKPPDYGTHIAAEAGNISVWLRDNTKFEWNTKMFDHLKLWNMAFILLQGDSCSHWNACVNSTLQDHLRKQFYGRGDVKEKLVAVFCQQLESFSKPLQECLTTLASEAIDGGHTVNYHRMDSTQKQRLRALLTSMFLKQWKENVKNESASSQVLLMALTWPPIQLFLKNKDEGAENQLLFSEAQTHLNLVITICESSWASIVNGNVEIGMLRLIHSHLLGFSSVMSSLVKKTNANLFSSVVNIRMKELEAFETQSRQMTILVNRCQCITTVDTSVVGRVLYISANDLESQSLNTFCNPNAAVATATPDNVKPKINAFPEPQDVLDVLGPFETLEKSFVFERMWRSTCSRNGRLCKTLLDVVLHIWRIVEKEWKQFAVKLESGDILFEEFQKMFDTFSGEPSRLVYEITAFGISEVIAQKRIYQLQEHRQLLSCVRGAKALLMVQRKYNLRGDFNMIKNIAQHTDHQFKMKDFNEQLLETFQVLKGISPEKVHCLEMFLKCDNLIRWLNESMKTSGQKELKVFVDLAMMSAGDEPLNIKKVQCLHSAVLGYSPLIFELDVGCDYITLINKCKIIWKELDANPNLPQQLVDTDRELPWLKEIKKAHGSVEVTSLMQADAINNLGVYMVGLISETEGSNSDILTRNVIKLMVPEKEHQRQFRSYSFSQLQDLQSRLMLVAGKSTQDRKDVTVDVEKFTLVFDSVTRLGGVFRKLCATGCVLFNSWEATFMCNTTRPVCVILSFGEGNDVPKLKGGVCKTEGLQDVIPELAKFMETCLREWLDYIRSKRVEYFHLNYFTVDQLVILQRELVKVGLDNAPSNHIYPLLSAVKHDCTPADLVAALNLAKQEVDNRTRSKDIEIYTRTQEIEMADGNSASNLEEKKMAFVLELVGAGIDESLALRSIDHVDIKDIECKDVAQALLWCMEEGETQHGTSKMDHDNDLDEIVEPQNPTQSYSGWNESTSTMATIIKANLSKIQQHSAGVAELIQGLSELWKSFLGSISSNISDYLSLEYLGIVLKHLAEKETVHRKLGTSYNEGEPNLIICPTEDIPKVTLSIYMHDKEQPLPTSDEVLVCSSLTSKDEVDIFWRRAIFGARGKIHCLMNADLLDYDVSEAAEQNLEEYILETTQLTDCKYRLFVICGSDNEYRSPFVSSLDKYVRQVQTVSPALLKEYVAEKLIVPRTRTQSASSVDFNRSSARVVKSSRAGVGKSLYVKRRAEALQFQFGQKSKKLDTKLVSIPLQEKYIDIHELIQTLLQHTPTPGVKTARLFHIDISHEVQEGIDFLLFNLLILNCLIDKNGYVWRRSVDDMCLIETMPIMKVTREKHELQYAHPMFDILPDVICRSPEESFGVYSGVKQTDFKMTDQLFDEKQFRSPVFQRTFQYLQRLDTIRNMSDVKPDNPEGDPKSCLHVLLRRCGVQNPSWSELHHFVWFLNTQLVDFELNQFVSVAAAEDLPGFAMFVLRFLMQMSKDFSTRSLKISEESPGCAPLDDMNEEEEEDDDTVLNRLSLRRTWESSPHPYLFFNSDRYTFTFLGFFIDRATGNLIDQQTRQLLEQGIMAQNLYDALVMNHAPLQENFDGLPRDQKILKLCNIMGIEFPHDPDSTYELTTDNVKKIMAIYMRFRCDIPVIVMGETGCGKTRLVKFMCALQCPPGVEVKNMILMKVHGGTTKEDIKRNVHSAERIATKNVDDFGVHMYTVLFFDEANTTEAIGIIKEIMCDRSICGEPLKLCQNLKMIAACNPYRKHPEELIKKLEQAGLGYHVDADETTDRLGRVPMRRLVYRVQPLPQSLLPLVWDFGQLNTDVEKLYIYQMVKRAVVEQRLPNKPGLVEVVSSVLATSQKYMRDQKDECSFVSLRDAERVLMVMAWFYEQANTNRFLFNSMDAILNENDETILNENDDTDEDDDINVNGLDDLTRCLVLAIGVCYHACLKTRSAYRRTVAAEFRAPCPLPNGAEQILEEIECCQDVFLDNVKLDDNIARNTALKENVFMMVVCIELRIPLFLVGKPGSSKSLAKTIVADAMQGNSAREQLFKHLKQVQMVSFQCSPLSTPDGIVGTFRQCAEFQKDKDPDTFVSAVVLDEVGLAEDSPRMPLKTLHPLLEDGCQGDETPERYKKVAFIGISNWALDPAKMNRGILVQREVPDLDELITSAKGICKTTEEVESFLEPFIEPLSRAYLKIFKRASDKMREFYGLRDFYSLVKMVYGFVAKNKRKPTWLEMLHAIKRNFGGLDLVNPEKYFKRFLGNVMHCNPDQRQEGPDCSPKGLIEACLFDSLKSHGESRYLLLLTDNYGTLSMIQQQILSKRSEIRPITIFGSSFRSDQEYTQVCRNINKIKVCMETGNTVVLLNLENLYESLYDALNQYYVYFGGERYVDLGLGTHRVKCPVHKNFRLIVVAEKQTVYKKFPIPLINRLEKHFLAVNTILDDRQLYMAKQLQGWAESLAAEPLNVTTSRSKRQMQVGEVFIGFHEDTCSATVMHICQKHAVGLELLSDEQVLEEAKKVLLWCATPEAIFRENKLDRTERELVKRHYNKEQVHVSAIGYLKHMIEDNTCPLLFAQITCHSKLLAAHHEKEIRNTISSLHCVEILSLTSFDTEQQFSNRVQKHFVTNRNHASLLVIQCDTGDMNSNLIACARHCVMDEFEKERDLLEAPSHIAIIVQLPRKAGGCFTGFQCGEWHSVHIDDLYPEDTSLPSIHDIHDKAVSELFFQPNRQVERIPSPTEPMETEPGDENPYRELTLHAMEVDKDSHANSDLQEGQIKNIEGLIMKCVQPALAMVKDRDQMYQRETKRVDIVLTSLRSSADLHDGSETFTDGIIRWLGVLLKEKEESGVWYLAKQWITRDAAAIDNINKNGTFRRSCFQTIVSKVKPVLAGIFALLDTNSNLDMVVYDDSWKTNFWIKCLNHKDFLQMKYSDFQSPKRKSELGEMLVSTTGFEGHQFRLRFPFSWMILETVETLFRDLVVEGDEIDRLERCAIGLRSGATGHMISELEAVLVDSQENELHNKSSPALHEVLEDYIHDFVQTVYNAERETELNIVCRMIFFKTVSLSQNATTSDLIRHIVSVRLAYQELSYRLAYFKIVNHIWPDCSAKIEEIQQSNTEHIMFKEHEFTFSTLCLLIEELDCSEKDLDDRNEQRKWLERVYLYRPVVETILQLQGEDDTLYGSHSFASVKRAKCMWSRVVVMKLFLENVCKNETKDKIKIKHCKLLWTLLGAETDFKEPKSLTAMEKFLKICNKAAVKDSIGSEVRCSRCEELLQSAPFSVPCAARHIICHTCCVEMKALREHKCPHCNERFEDHWKPVVDENRKIGNEKLEKYQQQCNTFFLEVITQLCFADEEPPSDEVLVKLLGYVTCTSKEGRRYTKNMNIFDTGVDPNPVFRSFLLQLMMKSSKERYVSKYLRQYIEEINLSVDVSTREMIDMYLLIIHCLEDTQFHYLEDSGESKALIVCHSMGNAVTVMNTPTVHHTDLLSAIASTRACLEVAARCLVRCLSHGASIQTFSPDDRKIIQKAEFLCENAATNWPKVYLVKLLCRRYGLDVYQKLSRSVLPIFKWLAIEGNEKQTEVCDRYIICGDTYTSIREAIARAVLGEAIETLDELLQGINTRGEQVETYLHLAIHREITCSNVRQSARGPSHGLPKLNKYLAAANVIQDKDLTGRLVDNKLRPDFMEMKPGNELMHQGLQCLLAHFHIVMSKLQAGSTLLDPLIMFTNGNPTIQSMLLPTMPQDDLEDIQAAVLANRGGDNPVFYRCPNGHPYYIGDCGRPYVVGNCPECRQQIGGTSHQALPGNVVNARGDSTQTGHILGRAIRGGVMRPERDLNPTYCTATRLFLHMAMYLGPVQQVITVIKPDLEDNQIPGFLLEHIRSNINDLQRALGRSGDDVLLLMHIAINIMMRKKETRVLQSVARLSSKADRKTWEAEFSAQILHDALGNVDALLRKWNKRLATDQRLGADPLMCLIYETDSSQELEDANQLVNIPRMWRFRTPITIEHMRQTLESKGQDETKTKPPLVLQRFMNEDCLLQALRYVPNILRLQRALLQKYQKKLDKTEANSIKVKDLKKELSVGHETERWINDFACAWEITRKTLEQYGCPTEFGRMRVPEEFCNQSILDDTPLAVFLPSTSGPGLCSYAMLDFLFRKQNGFLDSYIRESGRKDTKLPSIKPMAVTSAHLISYNHEQDLMPLVLANCHYSFEMGVGTKIEYDFAGMERQLMDRLLYSKSMIEFGRFLEIDLMIYRTEVTNQTVFMKLAERIPQSHLNGAVRTQICEELRRLPDVCRSLDNLDIAISFLKTTGGHPTAHLITFLVETLQIENAMLSQKARQCCELQHARALWLLLSFQKSKMLIDYRQSSEEVFETLQDDMYEDMDAELEAGFIDYMNNLSVDKLATILEVMHEFLLLSVSIRQNAEDVDFIDTTRYIFIDGLREYINQSEPVLAIESATLEDFPKGILYKHGAKAWVLAYTTLTRKIGNRRRY